MSEVKKSFVQQLEEILEPLPAAYRAMMERNGGVEGLLSGQNSKLTFEERRTIFKALLFNGIGIQKLAHITAGHMAAKGDMDLSTARFLIMRELANYITLTESQSSAARHLKAVKTKP